MNFEEFFRTTDLRHNDKSPTDIYYLITHSYFFFKEHTKLWPSGSCFRKKLKGFGFEIGKKNEIWYFCDIWYSNIIQSQIFFHLQTAQVLVSAGILQNTTFIQEQFLLTRNWFSLFFFSCNYKPTWKTDTLYLLDCFKWWISVIFFNVYSLLDQNNCLNIFKDENEFIIHEFWNTLNKVKLACKINVNVIVYWH